MKQWIRSMIYDYNHKAMSSEIWWKMEKRESDFLILRERVRNEKNFKFFIVFMIFKICMHWSRGIELDWNRVN